MWTKVTAKPPAQRDAEDIWWLATFYQMDGQRAEALEAYDANFKAGGDPASGLEAALLAGDLNDGARRDALLAESLKRGQTFKLADYRNRGWIRTELLELIKLFQATFAGGDQAKLDLEAVDKAIKTADPTEKLNLWYFTGRFL